MARRGFHARCNLCGRRATHQGTSPSGRVYLLCASHKNAGNLTRRSRWPLVADRRRVEKLERRGRRRKRRRSRYKLSRKSWASIKRARRRHKAAQARARRRGHICGICGRRVKTRRGLTRHITTKHYRLFVALRKRMRRR